MCIIQLKLRVEWTKGRDYKVPDGKRGIFIREKEAC